MVRSTDLLGRIFAESLELSNEPRCPTRPKEQPLHRVRMTAVDKCAETLQVGLFWGPRVPSHWR